MLSAMRLATTTTTAVVTIVVFVVVVVASASTTTVAAYRPPPTGAPTTTTNTNKQFVHPLPLHTPPLSTYVEERYYTQRINHFGPPPSSGTTTYQQRYLLSSEHHIPQHGPLFFYLGNEADVTLYANATGLIWENAKEFGALVVFAEHRYYGKSFVLPTQTTHAGIDGNDDDKEEKISNLKYLTSEQALEDYASLISYLRKEYKFTLKQAVIGFGGSYGGMLATWARLKYPNVFDGVVAASAPVVTFEGMGYCSSSDDDDDDKKKKRGECVNPNSFAEGVTYDVTTKAGVSSVYCEKNLRKAFGDGSLIEIAKTHPDMVRTGLNLCDDDTTTDKDLGLAARSWIDGALSYMAMGNFPYRSSYILNGVGTLPPYPVRVACEYLKADLTSNDHVTEWLHGLASFANVYYNATGTLKCNRLTRPVNNASQIVEELWNYQYCSEIFQIFGHEPSTKDMYWNEPWDGNQTAQGCYEQYKFYPDRTHFAITYGTPKDWIRYASNIVWSQGEYDPWAGGGIQMNLTNDLVGFVIPGAAHHLDLFWSHEGDTEAVREARELEMRLVKRWVEERRKNGEGGMGKKVSLLTMEEE